jgi:D-sedoheptulose 7-phosphate isomerase
MDLRSKNVKFNSKDISDFSNQYAEAIKICIEKVDYQTLEKIAEFLESTAPSRKKIFAVGNGGSASIAEHLCCDLVKGTYVEGHPSLNICSLTTNSSVFSAISNDIGYDEVYSSQIDFFGNRGDVLVAISSSGNSQNIINSVHRIKALGGKVIAFTGFDGGELHKIGDYCININYSNYGIVEDCHQILFHILAQYIYDKRIQY